MTETHKIGNVTGSLENAVPSPQELSVENDVTNIPVSLLEEIVKDGEHSVISPQLESSTSETDVNNLSNASLILPSEYLQTFDSAFSLGSHEFFLNNCGSKRLIIGLTSSGISKLNVTFKLHDLKNNYCLVFTIREWKIIVQHEMAILYNMLNKFEEEVCYCDQIHIETLYNRPCVKFCDIGDSHCTLALETFQHMMLLKNEIEETYISLNSKIKDIAKRMKLFMDVAFFLIFKSNNIDHRHYYNGQMLFLNKSSNFLDLSLSVTETWKQLGKWISKEPNAN